MKETWLIGAIILLLSVSNSFQECLLQSIRGVPSYVCGSVQELEAQGNRGLFDVVIHKYKSPPATEKPPNLKVVLVEDGKDGISPNTFKLLKDIHQLLSRNVGPVTLPARLLDNLPIQEVTLDQIGIVDIESDAFNNVNSLKKLHIINNRLSEVKYGVFNNLPLDALSLSNNRISFIEKHAFVNMTRLRRLDLNGNRLSEFQPEIIMNNPQKLEVLHLHNNTFTEIDRNTVRGLTNLKVLYLQNNRITQVSSYTFDNLLNLEELVLSNNLLFELNAESFPKVGLQRLQKLHINNNRLSFLTTAALERLGGLRSIRVTGNPWQCPCLDAILTWLGDRDVQQKCDRDYYDGTRPICVVDDVHPHTCSYVNNRIYFQKYSEINSMAPPSPFCEV